MAYPVALQTERNDFWFPGYRYGNAEKKKLHINDELYRILKTYDVQK